MRTLLCWLCLVTVVTAVDIPVKVTRVHDGDTFTVDVPQWLAAPGTAVVAKSMPVRIAGIDCPEMRDPNPTIRNAAVVAKLQAESLLKSGKVVLRDPQRDKYFRLNAQVLAGGVDVGKSLIEAKLAKPYDGGTKSPWTVSDLPQTKPKARTVPFSQYRFLRRPFR